MKIILLDFDTYLELDWSRYSIQLTESFNENQARSEYFDCLDKLKEILERMGSHSAFGEGDFGTGSDWYCPHRSLSFELSSDRLLTPMLIPTVQSVIHSLPHPYMVTITYDPFLQGSFHGLDSCDLYATIEPDAVTVVAKNDLILSLLGIKNHVAG